MDAVLGFCFANKWRAFWSIGCLSGFAAAGLMAIVMLALVPFGMPLSVVPWASLGCGVGTAIPNAIFAAVIA